MIGNMKTVLWVVVFIGLAAVVGALVIGGLLRDSEVEEDPYKAGLRFDEERKRASGFGWRTGVFIVMRSADEAEVRLTIKNREGLPVSLRPEDVGMIATRPAGDLKDVPCEAGVEREGELRALCAPLAFGHWEFVATIKTEKGPVKLVERTYVKKRTD